MDKIGLFIARLQATCDQIRHSIVAAQHENSPILEEANTLLKQRQDAEKKTQLLASFDTHFVISDEVAQVLTSSSKEIGPAFFSALERVKGIYGDCQILLGSESQRLGLELMEKCSRILNAAYQQLYHWTQLEFKSIDFENPQINLLARKALKILAERPNLFQNCLEIFADARDHALADGFYTALTGTSGPNSAGGGAKPIELSAHDPVRHVGDMLAWAHSAAVMEKEVLESFFIGDGDEIIRDLEAAKSRQPWSLDKAQPFDGRKVMLDLTGRNMTSVLTTLRQECEQIIRAQEDVVLTYNLINVFSFYRAIFTKLLTDDSVVMDSLGGLESSALAKFDSLLRDHYASLKADANVPSEDSSIPDFLQDGLTQVGLLLGAYDSSMTPVPIRPTSPSHIVETSLKPAIEICEDMARESEEPTRSIFLVNCFSACRTKVLTSGHAIDCLADWEVRMAESVSTLIDHQHAYLLHHSGLHPLLAALASVDEETVHASDKMTKLPELQPAALHQAAQNLDDFLPSALMDASDNLKYVISRHLADEITSEAVERFCEDFEYVEGKLISVDTSREQQQHGSSIAGSNEALNMEMEETLLRSFYPRTSGEIRVLLSL